MRYERFNAFQDATYRNEKSPLNRFQSSGLALSSG